MHRRHALLGLLAAALPCLPPIPNGRSFVGRRATVLQCSRVCPKPGARTKNVVWRTPIAGKGHSSPVIAGNQIWLTTGIEDPITPEEKAKRLAGNTGDQPLTVAGKLTMRAICVDRAGGPHRSRRRINDRSRAAADARAQQFRFARLRSSPTGACIATSAPMVHAASTRRPAACCDESRPQDSARKRRGEHARSGRRSSDLPLRRQRRAVHCRAPQRHRAASLEKRIAAAS